MRGAVSATINAVSLSLITNRHSERKNERASKERNPTRHGHSSFSGRKSQQRPQSSENLADAQQNAPAALLNH
jgi:hypothetical protein